MNRRWNFYRLAAFTAVLITARLGWCPEIVFDALHLEQGFNFRQDVQDACGFISSLKIANTTLTPDITAKNPGTDGTTSPMPVVGVMSYFKWSGGRTDPIQLKFNVSGKNRNTLFKMLHGSIPNLNVSFSLGIFYFDQSSAQFYMTLTGANSATSVLKGSIAKEGKEKLLLSLPSQLASEVVKSPQNWEVELTVMPAALSQQIVYQSAPGQKTSKPWGISPS